MSKQVRFRRGTTAQHATFTGADGEVTFDTDKKCLVLHDGATPGGVALVPILAASPGGPSAVQTLASCLSITGGADVEDVALSVAHKLYVGGLSTLASVSICGLTRIPKFLAFATPVILDFGSWSHGYVALGGNLSLATANLGWGACYMLRVLADASPRTLTFPAGWRWLCAVPTTLAANKMGSLELIAYGVADSDIQARWSAEP